MAKDADIQEAPVSTRKYVLSITREEKNPSYIEDSRYNMGTSQFIQIRELYATITEEELNIIKQALIKVWS